MLKHIWNPKQYEFITSEEPFIALLGGKGSGKTTALCRKAVILSYENDNVGYIGRYKLSQSEDALLHTLENMLTGYIWKKKRDTGGWSYIILNKYGRWSTIKVRSLRDIGNISGMNLGFFGISEVDDIHLTEAHWRELCNRLRLATVKKHYGFCEGTRVGNCDLGGWVLKVCKTIYTTTVDNYKNLPEGFKKYIDGLNDSDKARVITGMYDVLVGGQLVYPEFDIKRHTDDISEVIQKWKGGNDNRIWLGIDCPYQLACVIGVIYRDKLYIVKEVFEENNLSQVEFLDKVCYEIKLLNDKANVIAVIDPAGGRKDSEEHITMMERLFERGFRVIFGDQRIKDREEAVKTLLLQDKLIISKDCNVLITGFISGYIRKMGTNGVLSDKPLKNRYSHLQDGLAYLCSQVEFEEKRKVFNTEEVIERYSKVLT